MRRHCTVIAVLSFALAACQDALQPELPRIVSFSDEAAGPHARILEITLDRLAPVIVTYESDDGDRMTVLSFPADAHTVALAGLRAGRTYTYDVVGHNRTGTFQTPPLPEDLAAVRFTATGSPTTPLALVHLYHADGFRGYAAVDQEGEVVWHQRTDDFPFGITRRASGNFVYMDKDAGLVEVTPFGEVISTLPQDNDAREMHHDVIATPWHTILFIAFDTRTHDGSALKGEAIWEWIPETGLAEQRWSSWNDMSPDADRGPRFGEEWLHANALGIGAGGNILISLHYLNQIVSIAPDWIGLEWRLGGPNATIATAADAFFSGQHTAREVGNDRVLLFDNGIDRGGPSRALELALGTDEATVAWEWSPPTQNFATAVSSARRLVNGNTLVAFGMSTGLAGSTGPTEVYEVTAQGTVAWHLLVEGPSVMFRAEPLATVAGEVRLP